MLRFHLRRPRRSTPLLAEAGMRSQSRRPAGDLDRFPREAKFKSCLPGPSFERIIIRSKPRGGGFDTALCGPSPAGTMLRQQGKRTGRANDSLLTAG